MSKTPVVDSDDDLTDSEEYIFDCIKKMYHDDSENSRLFERFVYLCENAETKEKFFELVNIYEKLFKSYCYFAKEIYNKFVGWPCGLFASSLRLCHLKKYVKLYLRLTINTLQNSQRLKLWILEPAVVYFRTFSIKWESQKKRL